MSDPASRSRWTSSALWAAVLLVSSSWPNPGVPQFGHGDKVVHALLFGVLAWLVGRAWSSLGPSRVALSFAGIAAFAALDEWHQAFIPGRSASVADWIADVGGAAVGLLAVAARRRAARAA